MTSSKQKKSVKVTGGSLCPKCKLTMQRFEHGRDWRPKPGQSYYFKFWDMCKPCNHIQMYEVAKVFTNETV